MMQAVILGKVKGSVLFEKGERSKASFTLSVRRYDADTKKTFYDNVTVVAVGGIAEKANTLMKDDMVVVSARLRILEKGVQVIANSLNLIGEEGVNLHFIAGAVDEAELSYTSKGNSMCKMKVRVPSKSYQGDGFVDTWMSVVAWETQAERMYESLAPTESKSKWVLLQCSSKNNSYEVEGERRNFMQSTASFANFTGVETDRVIRSQRFGSKGEEGDSVGVSDLSKIPDDSEIPF